MIAQIHPVEPIHHIHVVQSAGDDAVQDIEAEKCHDTHQDPPSGEQVADGHSQIEVHKHCGAHDQQQEEELQEVENNVGLLYQIAEDRLPQLGVEDLVPIQRHHQEHG